MEIIFIKVLSMAIRSIPVLLLVLMLRIVFSRAPKNSRQTWWALACLSLVPIPFPELFQYVLKSFRKVKETQLTITDTLFKEVVIHGVFNGSTAMETTNTSRVFSWTSILSWIWIAGIGIMILYAACQNIILYRKTNVSIKEKRNTVLCDNISVPFTVGLIHPVIYLPSSINEVNKKYALLHEDAHIKRKDTLWKIIGYLFLCVYWFHPLVWICYYLFNTDIEYACDERVTEKMESEQRKGYATALLSLTDANNQYPHSLVSFSASNVKQRIKEIAKNKKIIHWLSVVVIVVAIICGLLFLPSQNEIYDRLLPIMPTAQNEYDVVVPINMDNNKPYFVSQNKVYHLVEMGNEISLDSIHVEEIIEPVSREEQDYWKSQIAIFNKEHYGDRSFEPVFYMIEGFPASSYVAIIDKTRNVAILLVNDNGYIVSSPYELFEGKACLSNYVSITVIDVKNEKRIVFSKDDPEQEQNISIINNLLSEINGASFEAPLYSKRLSSAFQYLISFTDINGISRTLYISRDREVYIPQFGDTPGVIISQELYDQVVGLFMRGEE